MNKLNLKKLIAYWQKGSNNDWMVAQKLFKLGHYNYCLFFCHLALEKQLKALVVAQIKDQAPFTHDLYVLALKAGLVFDLEQRKNLETVTTFNISARYDNVKLAFYKKATKKYAEKYLKISADLKIWLEKELTKK